MRRSYPIVRSLSETLNERSLNEWECPALEARLQAAMVVAYRAADEENDAEEAYTRLCELDVSRAYDLMPEDDE